MHERERERDPLKENTVHGSTWRRKMGMLALVQWEVCQSFAHRRQKFGSVNSSEIKHATADTLWLVPLFTVLRINQKGERLIKVLIT